jgi:hypothetical protein
MFKYSAIFVSKTFGRRRFSEHKFKLRCSLSGSKKNKTHLDKKAFVEMSFEQKSFEQMSFESFQQMSFESFQQISFEQMSFEQKSFEQSSLG